MINCLACMQAKHHCFTFHLSLLSLSIQFLLATLSFSETTDSTLLVSIAMSGSASFPPNTHPLGDKAVGIHDSVPLTSPQPHQTINTRREFARVPFQLLRVHVAQVESNGLPTLASCSTASPLRHRTRKMCLYHRGFLICAACSF